MPSMSDTSLTPRMTRALAAACETRVVKTHGNIAKALERRGLAKASPLELQGGTMIEPTDEGRALIESLGGPREARKGTR